jgi:hypothetical protein
MNYNILTYCFYLLITLFVVFYVGHVLYKNGRPFLLECFRGNNILADAVNKILLAGYYLVNAGYAIIVLRIWSKISSLKQMLDVLGEKAGTIILTLGLMHVFNIIILILISRNKKTVINNINQ